MLGKGISAVLGISPATALPRAPYQSLSVLRGIHIVNRGKRVPPALAICSGIRGECCLCIAQKRDSSAVIAVASITLVFVHQALCPPSHVLVHLHEDQSSLMHTQYMFMLVCHVSFFHPVDPQIVDHVSAHCFASK